MTIWKYDVRGQPVDIEADTEEEAIVKLTAQIAQTAPPIKPKSPEPERWNPAEGYGPVDKFAIGRAGGLRKVYLGAKGLVTDRTPEETEELKTYEANQKYLGVPGAIGEGTTEAGLTAPIGGPVSAVGKVLTKAAPLAKAAKYGFGKVANLGTASRATAEGALSQGIIGDPEDQTLLDRLDDIAMGGAVPAGVGAALLPLKGTHSLARTLASTKAKTAERAYKVLERTEGGPEGLTNALRAIRESGDSLLPKSTAALTGSAGSARLESGARSRSNVDWQSHDDSIGYLAWRELEHSPDGKRPSEGMQAILDTFKRNDIPLGKVAGRTLPVELQEPFVNDVALRAALAKSANGMRPAEIAHVRRIANELAQFEGAAGGSGITAMQHGDAGALGSAAAAVASAVTNSTVLWKMRAAANTMTGLGKAKTTKLVDELMHDPNKYAELVERIREKTAAGEKLSYMEQTMQELLLAINRQDEMNPGAKNAP